MWGSLVFQVTQARAGVTEHRECQPNTVKGCDPSQVVTSFTSTKKLCLNWLEWYSPLKIDRLVEAHH